MDRPKISTSVPKVGLVSAMMKLTAIFVALFAIGLAKPGYAGFDEGLAAAEREDFKTALREWRPLAGKGHAGALFNLGLMYSSGHGVPRNHELAVEYYRQAAELDHSYAQMNYAIALKTGRGVKQNHAESVKWFRKVAKKGHVGAQFNLAMAYTKGLGVERDPVEAVLWFSDAAEGGLHIAQYNLARAHENGEGVVRNEVQALKWYILAAHSFPPGESKKVAINARDNLISSLDKAQVTEVKAWLFNQKANSK